MSEAPIDEERPAKPKPVDKKPLAVWIAQVLCAFGSAGALYFALFASGAASKLAMGLLALLYLALLYGTEKRKAWSRWLLAAFLALGAVSTLLQALRDPTGARNPNLAKLEIKPEEQSGVAAGQAATIVLIFLLAGRLAFGAPSKRYFGGSIGAGKD
jgi:hypothetical protein